MKKVKLTQSDIDQNPLLKKIGAKAGLVMQYSFVSSVETQSNESNKKDDTGGSNPPPSKEKPDKP